MQQTSFHSTQREFTTGHLSLCICLHDLRMAGTLESTMHHKGGKE